MRKITSFLALMAALILSAQACPENCVCTPGRFDCGYSSRTSIIVTKDTQFINLTHNEISVLGNKFFKGHLGDLRTLFLNNNEMELIEPEALSSMLNLQYLYLQNNQLKRLHESVFQNNQNLKIIDLSENYLEEISPILFEFHQNLLWINVTGNKLNVINTVRSMFTTCALNSLRIEFCAEPNPYVSYLLNIPILNELRKKSIFNLSSANNIHTNNMISYKLDKNNSYNYTMLYTTSNSTDVCFCNENSAWFLCPENEFKCKMKSHMYSYLNCNSSIIKRPTINITQRTSTTRNIDSTISVMKSQHKIHSETATSPRYSISTISIVNSSMSSNNRQDGSESETDTDISKYAYISSAVILLVIVIVTVLIIWCRKRMTSALNGTSTPTTSVLSVEYRTVPTTSDTRTTEVQPYHVTNLLSDP